MFLNRTLRCWAEQFAEPRFALHPRLGVRIGVIAWLVK